MPPSTKERIILAAIPVIGTIVVALIAILKQDPNTHKLPPPLSPDSVKTAELIKITELKNKAGKINDMLVYGRYDDVLPNMTESLKASIPRKLFTAAQDSIHKNFGDFIKPIDTSYSSGFGASTLIVKNQYQKGTNVTQMIFDNQKMLISLITTIK